MVPRTGFIKAKKPIEDSLAVFSRDPGPFVANSEMYVVPIRVHANTDRRIPRAVFDRVIDHIRDRLAQHQPVSGNRNALRAIDRHPLIALFRENPQDTPTTPRKLPP